jgi:hypothetical protein
MKTVNKTSDIVKSKVRINPDLKTNPTDPFIKRKIEKVTNILKNLNEPLLYEN